MKSLQEIAQRQGRTTLSLALAISNKSRAGTLIEEECSMIEQVRFGEWLDQTNLINGGQFALIVEARPVPMAQPLRIVSICEMDFSGDEAKLKVVDFLSFYNEDTGLQEFKLTAESFDKRNDDI